VFPAFNTLPSGPATGLTDRQILSRNYGLYVSDLITLTPWLKISAAARKFSEFSKTYADHRNNPTGLKRKTTGKNFLPSIGVLIEPTRHLTIYGSYAESFVPVDPGLFDLTGQNNFTPITGKQYEFGVKTENLLDGKLGFTAAVYQIDNIGQTTQTICPLGSCTVQLGSARSRGFEIEGTATPVTNWQIIFGYTNIDAKVRSAGPGFDFQVGRRLPNVARNAANLWTRYDWQNGFGVGLGVTYTGQREGVLPTQATDLKRLNLPAYTVVDAGLYYSTKKFSVNLKLGNILDKKYFENSGGGSQGRVQIQPGQPRYLTLTTRVTF
jgi:iron complex outermembrane receptor protein